MKRLVAAGLVILLLVGVSRAYAGNAGTSSDPLVSQSYINDTFKKTVKEQAEKIISDSFSSLASAVGTASSSAENASFASGYDQMQAKSGATLKVFTGGSVIMLSGSMTLSKLTGTVISISTGNEIAVETALEADRRYFMAEDTTAEFTLAEGTVFNVNGSYVAKNTGEVTAVTSNLKYLDVKTTSWFYDAAKYVYETKLYYDYNSDYFRPEDPATRAELVYALWMANGCPKVTDGPKFDDLTETWYVDAVEWAAKVKIVEGYGNGKFGPDKSATREQIAAIMYRYAQYMGYNLDRSADLTKYEDAGKISSWAVIEMSWANTHGLITGVTDTILRPQGTATRAQVATIVMRYVTGA